MDGLWLQIDGGAGAIQLLVHHGERIKGNLALHWHTLCAEANRHSSRESPINGVQGDRNREHDRQQVGPLGSPQALQAPKCQEHGLDRRQHTDDEQVHADAEGDRIVATASAINENRITTSRGVLQRHIRDPCDRIAGPQDRVCDEGHLLHREATTIQAASAARDEDPHPAHPNRVANEGQQKQRDYEKIEEHQVPSQEDGRQHDRDAYAQHAQANLLLKYKPLQSAISRQCHPHFPDRRAMRIHARHIQDEVLLPLADQSQVMSCDTEPDEEREQEKEPCPKAQDIKGLGLVDIHGQSERPFQLADRDDDVGALLV
mmetsp:Transcript_96326/g.276568  ORF Transcript_96326/g.276568 Transcript_96326/m.276568 type:complete len:317 (+) Transcript_96326:704-1654(+)